MAAEYTPAPDFVIEIAQELVDQYHPWLQDTSIGFLMRSEAPQSNGQITYGQASKVKPELRALGVDYDFLIWLAHDQFVNLSARQRVALIDHELCHCVVVDGKAKIRPHDVTEFNCIIERHGFWWPSAEATIVAIQPHLPLEQGRRGRVEAVDMGALLKQVGQGFLERFPETEVSVSGEPVS
jgi:hypothetical protein